MKARVASQQLRTNSLKVRTPLEIRTPSAPGSASRCSDSLHPLSSASSTTKQAAGAGYSPQLLAYYRDRKVDRVRRGIYRLVHFPASDHEDLVILWLWSEQEGVFSHERALAFKQALEHRLKASSTTGTDFARRRQLLVCDRFLALR